MTIPTRATLRLSTPAALLPDLPEQAPDAPIEVEAEFSWLAAKTLTHAGSCRDEYGNRWQVVVPERLKAAATVRLCLHGPLGSGSVQRRLALKAILRGQPLTLTPALELPTTLPTRVG